MNKPTWYYRPAPMLDLGLRALTQTKAQNSTERMVAREKRQ